MLQCTHNHHRNPLSGLELRTRVAKVLKHTAKNFTTLRDFFNDYSYFFYDAPLPDFKDDSGERYAVCRKIGAELSGSVEFALGTMRPEDWSESSLKEAISASAEEVVAKNNDSRKQVPPDREFPLVKDAIQDVDVQILNTQEAYKATQLYLRWAIARGGSGPPMHTVMAILGRDISLQRLYELRELLQAEAVMLNKEEETL